MIISIDNDILTNLGGIHSNSLTELVEIDETNKSENFENNNTGDSKEKKLENNYF